MNLPAPLSTMSKIDVSPVEVKKFCVVNPVADVRPALYGTLINAAWYIHASPDPDGPVPPVADFTPGNQETSADPPAATVVSVADSHTTDPSGATSCNVGRNAEAAPEPSTSARTDLTMISCAPGTL